MTIGERIHDILIKKRLKQIDLAVFLGTNSSTVIGWKKGKTPSSDVIVPISEFLGVSVEYILTGKENTNNLPMDLQELIHKYGTLDSVEKKLVMERINAFYEKHLSTE